MAHADENQSMIPLKDTIQSRSTPWVTWAIILVNGIVFLFELSLSPEQLERLVALFGMTPARL